jgi:hypothetical protein
MAGCSLPATKLQPTPTLLRRRQAAERQRNKLDGDGAEAGLLPMMQCVLRIKSTIKMQ